MKITRKQKFTTIYAEEIYIVKWIFNAIIALLFYASPMILAMYYHYPSYLWLYLLVPVYFLIIIGIRFDRLSRLPLTKEEKAALHINSAEDCIVFLNLYLRFKDHRFTLFDNKEFKKQIDQFVRSSMTELEGIYENQRKSSKLFYSLNVLTYGFSEADILRTSRYYGDVDLNWQITDFCKDNFERALKEKWSWERYVNERKA